MCDINETITNLTMEYLKSKYPIYKIEVVESRVWFDDDGEDLNLNTDKKTLILEADYKFYKYWKSPTDPNLEEVNETDKRCSLGFIKKCDCGSIIKINKLRDWYIISCKRIA